MGHTPGEVWGVTKKEVSDAIAGLRVAGENHRAAICVDAVAESESAAFIKMVRSLRPQPPRVRLHDETGIDVVRPAEYDPLSNEGIMTVIQVDREASILKEISGELFRARRAIGI